MTTAFKPQPSDDGLRANSIENRVAGRSSVTWRGRLLSAQGQLMDVKLADISSSGIGFTGDRPLVVGSVMQIALQVPHLTTAGSFTVVTGQIKIAFHVLKADLFRTGAQWIKLDEASQNLLKSWLDRLPTLP